MRFVFVRIDQRRAEIGRRRGGAMRRQCYAQPERRQPRIGIGQADCLCVAAAAVPRRENAEGVGQILDHDLGAQFVEIEFFHKRADERAGHVEKKAAAIRGRRFCHHEIGDDFALRRQQRGKARYAGRELEHVGGDEAMEEITRAVAGNFDHAAVG